MTRRSRSVAVRLAVVLLIGVGSALGTRALVGTPIPDFVTGFVVGALATLSVVGIVYGVWEARRLEERRKAQEQIWLKH